MSQKTFNYLSWGVVFAALALVTYVWGNGLDWRFSDLTILQWFPLFGLIAWTIMAEHYYLGTIRILKPGLKKPRYFRPITGWLVLGSILLHPGLLTYELSRRGLGTPPQSYVDFIGEGFRVALMLGTISLVIFLSFEIFDRIKRGQVLKKWWWMVSISQSIAMVLIWVHGYRLGTHISGWFEAVWIILGLALIPCFYVIHRSDFVSAGK